MTDPAALCLHVRRYTASRRIASNVCSLAAGHSDPVHHTDGRIVWTEKHVTYPNRADRRRG